MRLPKLALLSFAIATAAFLTPAASQDAGIQLAQVQYDIWTDRRGRTFLIDPYTGEIVRRVFRERRSQPRRLTREQRRRLRLLERQDRRATRRTRLERELDRALELDDEDDFYEEDFDDRPRGRRGRYLDDYENEPVRPQNRDRRVRREPLPETKSNESVASLPEETAPKRRQTLGGFRKPNYGREQMAALQVALDRGGFSPGVIDGKWGTNVANAMSAWKEAKGNNRLGNPKALKQQLAKTGGDAFFDYTLTASDVAGPFSTSIPVDYARKAQLDRLAYTSVPEKIAEKFHMSEAYLRALNPGKNFNKSGTRIRVVAPGTVVRSKVHYIIADKSREQVRAMDRNGRLVAAYPATIGSAATPSPSGTHTVERIALNPNYTYNPKLNFQQGNNDKILTIPPGPNGPVGSVWIALSKPTYGIHGTPNPDKIGKTNSHGCIRLTNWDAQELAKLVTKGVTVEFRE